MRWSIAALARRVSPNARWLGRECSQGSDGEAKPLLVVRSTPDADVAALLRKSSWTIVLRWLRAEVLARGLCPGVGAARFAERERAAEVLVREAGSSCGLCG